MLPPRDEPENLDVLQNIEFAVVNFYRAHPDLTDHNVDKVYEALMRGYRGQNPPTRRLNELEQGLYDAVRAMTEAHLGRASGRTELPTITLQEMVDALKRLRNSVHLWTGNAYGRRGYLDYVKQWFV